jgi:hypothetical protein
MDKPTPLHTMSSVRRATSLLAAALLALLAASAAQAANPLVTAVKRSASARSAVIDMQVTTAAGGATIALTGTGAVRGREAKLSVRTKTGPVAIAMDVILLREGPAYVMYMRSPALQAQLPAGKSWLRYDLQNATTKLGIDFTKLVETSQTLGPLERGIVSTSRVGRETVAGSATTHYKAVVDLHRAAAALPAYAKQLAALEGRLGTRIGRSTQHVWVGADGRIRRLRSSTPTVVQGVKATSVQTLTYRAYDVAVSISAPPRSQVFDIG